MDYKTNLVLHISYSFFFLFLVHCLYSIVFLISVNFMDFLINKLYLVSYVSIPTFVLISICFYIIVKPVLSGQSKVDKTTV